MDIPAPAHSSAAVFNSAISVQDVPFQDSTKIPGELPPAIIAAVTIPKEPQFLLAVFTLLTSVQLVPFHVSVSFLKVPGAVEPVAKRVAVDGAAPLAAVRVPIQRPSDPRGALRSSHARGVALGFRVGVRSRFCLGAPSLRGACSKAATIRGVG